MARPYPWSAASTASAVLVLALSAPAAGERFQVPISDSILQGMSETTETLRVGVLTSPGAGAERENARRDAVRTLLATALDTVKTGAVPEAAQINLEACRPLDRVLATVRKSGTPQQIADLEFFASCLVDNYVGRISFAAAHLETGSQTEDPLAPKWGRAADRIYPLLLRAAQEFFPPEGVTRRPSAVRAFRKNCRAARIAAEFCDWVVVPDAPPPE